ncbi:MAG: aspartate ammonia-lyase, aspartate ammonia-lyase [Candidatus Gottesmanbacteria bacterium GW2011_GWA2_43_14]|uniref:Aspartate ammonia-lyase, aspartate ammonia-lyase n=1 Tax=Candidatus Gottesmanbacteria bacterium GW2011_GWA2_43_14 TaxID=1618443 RepID=A0A0G1DKV9_9BACT|nr:MAG: aspartate ammonia-lyase, aspartate ammonia-lyase [Candidatus Gottesmanbacteria bacterium GW2011_GWA2_43_14]
MKYRTEKDSLGKVSIPADTYYGIQTWRALQNFPVSGLLPDPRYVKASVLIKKAAALANYRLKLLDKDIYQAIIFACDRILAGYHSDQFVVDPFQAGAGTSHHMNINEVIANIASEKLGFPKGIYTRVHPHNHVNLAQSTNDVIPAAARLTVLLYWPDLASAVDKTVAVFQKKGREFAGIHKSGRTHLSDALPVTLGQEFKAYASALKNDLKRLQASRKNLFYLGLGGTAVGTGVNSHPAYRKLVIKELAKLTGLKLKAAPDSAESMQNVADLLDFSGALRILSQNLIRISNDLRLLSSGPGTGLAELTLPEVQAGSTIMPGKVNPSLLEMLTMTAFQVIGSDQTILLASMHGQLELNVFLPVVVHNLTNQIRILTNALGAFESKYLRFVEADREMCNYWLEKSSGLAAILNPHLGYEKAAELYRESRKSKIPITELVVKKGLMTSQKAKAVFDLKKIIKPNLTGNKK